MAGKKRITKPTMPTSISKMQITWSRPCPGKCPHKAAATRTRQIKRVSRGANRETNRLPSIDSTSQSLESSHRLSPTTLRVNLPTLELIISMVIRKIILRRKRSRAETIHHRRVRVIHRVAATVHHRYLQIHHNLENIIEEVHLKNTPPRKSIKQSLKSLRNK